MAGVILLGLALGVGVVAGVSGGNVPLVASAVDSDDRSSDTTTMTETEFPWGTVTHETDPDTGETHVGVLVDAEDDVSVSVAAAPDATDVYSDEDEVTDQDAGTETFPWGTVTYAADSDAGATDVDILVDTEDDVSLSVTTVSDDGTESTSIVQATGESGGGSAGSAETNVSVTQSTIDGSAGSTSVSQSTTSSTDASISISIDDREEER